MTNLKDIVLIGDLDQVRKLNNFLMRHPLRAAQVREFITLTEDIKGLSTYVSFQFNHVDKLTPHIVTNVTSEEGEVLAESCHELNRFYGGKLETFQFTRRVKWLEATTAERAASDLHPEQYGK